MNDLLEVDRVKEERRGEEELILLLFSPKTSLDESKDPLDIVIIAMVDK